MSIPGLGQLAPQPVASTSSNRTIVLPPLGEWRFQVPLNSPGVTVRVLKGTAERDGTALALNRTYKFTQYTKSKLLTWHGCTLNIEGACDDSVVEYPRPEDSPMVSYLNLHYALQDYRNAAAQHASAGHAHAHTHAAGAAQGPRVLICGPRNSGKTSLARMLAALATRMSYQPMVVNLDPDEGLLSLPGTVSAAVYGTLMDIEEPAGGFGIGSTPSSGPSAVPVKIPIVYYFGREKVDDDVQHWRDLTTKLGGSVRAKLQADQIVRASGVIVDTPAVEPGKGGVDLIAHAVNEFAANIVVVLGSDRMYGDLQHRLARERTPHGEAITVVSLEKSDGATERDGNFMRHTREAAIKEYFFGDSRRTLSPSTQSVGFDEMAIYKAPDESEAYEGQPVLEPVEISGEMSAWTLAIMNASVNDPPETIRQAPVVGFISVFEVDEDRRRLKVLSSIGGRLSNKPVVWGRWPEPYINLLG